MFAVPTVETVGYFRSPLPGLAARIFSVKQGDSDADMSALERKIDQFVYVLYCLSPEEIKLVEGAAK